jgi:hypothetical protein
MAKPFGSNLLNWLREFFPAKEALPLIPKYQWQNVHFVVGQGDERKTLSLVDFEKMFSISYIPYLSFQKFSYFSSCFRKTSRYDRKGLLDYEQRWLGVYFKKEILSAEIPLVSLSWINSVAGWGVFAERDFKQMDFIGEYVGVVRKKRKKDRTNSYCFEYAVAKGESTRFIIDAEKQGNITRFLNHSPKPNLSSTIAVVHRIPRVIFYARRPIKKGEQLYYDYGPDYWKRRSRPQEFD